MSDKIKTGRDGENLAADYLKSKGYSIVARNYRHKKAEIDLIVQREDWLLFIEVKTRTSTFFGQPEEFVDQKKARMIFNAAEEYIFSTDWQGHVRFDVVAITIADVPKVVHFEDAIN